MYISIHGTQDNLRIDGQTSASFGSAERKLGPWAKWHWNGYSLSAEVDRYGFYPLFYSSTPEYIILSNSIAELISLGAPKEFDNTAIAAFLRLGFFLGEETPFLNIKAFPPNGQLTWQPIIGLKVSSSLIKRKPDYSISRKEIIDNYVDRFRSAISRSLVYEPDHIALPLSGGRDSRHIALELKRVGVQPGLVISQRHFQYRNDDDYLVASDLCKNLGWSLVIQDHALDPVESEFEKNRIFDCLTDEHAWFLPSAKRISNASIHAIYDGLAGDVLSNSLFIRKEWQKQSQNENYKEWLHSMPSSGYGTDEDALNCILTPERKDAWSWDLAYDRVKVELSKYHDDDNPINQLMFWNRTRREIAPFFIRFLPEIEVITPYCDPEVFDFLWNIPTEQLEDHKLHDQAIAIASPQYADIPFEGKVPSNSAGDYHADLLAGMASRRLFWLSNSSLINRRWLRPRLAASLLHKGYGRTSGWYARWVPWLASLELLAGK